VHASDCVGPSDSTRSTVFLIWGHFVGQLGSAPSSCNVQTCVNAFHMQQMPTLKMADAQTSPPPFAKSRSRLLSLDEVPHKRHVPPPVLSRENPLVPEPGTPAFAERKDQFAANTAEELRQEQETRRQQRKVCSSMPLLLARGCLPWCSPGQTTRQHVLTGIPEPKKTMPRCS
jgi:hypothetical protein